MNETLKELAGDLQMIHQFLEQAEATERQLERYVRELEREKAKAVADESRHWVDIIRRLDPENLCDYFDGLGNEEHLRQWLAARDAQQRREGAAAWLENAVREGGYYERSSDGMLEEAKQLREGKA